MTVAHPHVYIDMEMSLDVDSQGIAGLWQRWTLLRNFSPDIIIQYDEDKNGFFDENEQKNIYNKAFLGAAPYYYFTFITIDDREYVSLKVENFSAVIQGDLVIYSFYIPTGISADEKLKSIEVVTYDPTGYVSFGFQGLRDPLDENIDYTVEFIRDGGIYSHRNDLGQLHLFIDLKLSPVGLTNDHRNHKKDQLEPLGVQTPVPVETASNPFIISGVWLESDKKANPFLN
jgi:ABC-type uncharacterized transport system substrate-binding protein